MRRCFALLVWALAGWLIGGLFQNAPQDRFKSGRRAAIPSQHVPTELPNVGALRREIASLANGKNIPSDQDSIRKILDNHLRRQVFAEIIWAQSGGRFIECIKLLRLIPGTDSYATQQLLAAKCADMKPEELAAQIRQLLPLGNEPAAFLQNGLETLIKKDASQINELAQEIRSGGTLEEKAAIVSLLMGQKEPSQSHIRLALEVSEGTSRFAATVKAATRKLAHDPEEAKRLCASAGQGTDASKLRAACLKSCTRMPVLDKVPILADIESTVLRRETAWAIGQNWSGNPVEIVDVATQKSPGAQTLSASMTITAWSQDPGSAAAALLRIDDEKSSFYLWDTVIRSWQKHTSQAAALSYLNSLTNLPPAASAALRVAVLRVHPEVRVRSDTPGQ